MSTSLTLEQRFLLAEAASIELLRRTQALQTHVSAQPTPIPPVPLVPQSSQLSDLQTQLQHLQSQNRDLQTQNQALQTQNQNLTTEDAKNRVRVEELVAKDEERKGRLDELSLENQQLQGRDKEMQVRVRQLEDEVAALRRMSGQAGKPPETRAPILNGVVNGAGARDTRMSNGILEHKPDGGAVQPLSTGQGSTPNGVPSSNGALNGISKPTSPTNGRPTLKSFVNGIAAQPSINGISSPKGLTNGITYPTVAKPQPPPGTFQPRNSLPKALRQPTTLLDLGDSPDPSLQPSPSILTASTPAAPQKATTAFEQAVHKSPVYGLYPNKDALKRSLQLHTDSWHPSSGGPKYPLFFDEGVLYTPPPGSSNERRAIVLSGLDPHISIEEVLAKIHTGPILSISTSAAYIHIVFVHAESAAVFAKEATNVTIRGVTLSLYYVPTPTTPIPAFLFNGIHMYGFSRVLGIRQLQGRVNAWNRVTVEAVRRMGWQGGPEEALMRIWKDRQEDMIIAVYTGIAAAMRAREDMFRSIEFQNRTVDFLRDPCEGGEVEGKEVKQGARKPVSVVETRNGSSVEEGSHTDAARDDESGFDSDAYGNDATAEAEDLMDFSEAKPTKTHVAGTHSLGSEKRTSTPMVDPKEKQTPMLSTKPVLVAPPIVSAPSFDDQ